MRFRILDPWRSWRPASVDLGWPAARSAWVLRGPPRGSGRYGADGGAAPPDEIIKAQVGIMESDDS